MILNILQVEVNMNRFNLRRTMSKERVYQQYLAYAKELGYNELTAYKVTYRQLWLIGWRWDGLEFKNLS